MYKKKMQYDTPETLTAIRKLRPNEQFQIIDGEFSMVDGSAPPTDAELRAAMQEGLSATEQHTLAMESVRAQRNMMLSDTDYLVFKAVERGVNVPQAVVEYRQKLRDLPDTLSELKTNNAGILTSEISYPTLNEK
jgi:hypothetical protein